jgi:hypothetical protein
VVKYGSVLIPEQPAVPLQRNITLSSQWIVFFGCDMKNGETWSETFFSIGGGFVVKEGESNGGKSAVDLPFPINTSDELLHWCMKGMSIHEVVMENENCLAQ